MNLLKSGKKKKRFHKRIKSNVKVEVVEYASDQLSIVLEDLQLGEVERVDNILFPMVQDEIVLIPYIDFVCLFLQCFKI